MKISVIIPNWNGKNFLGDCLDSLRKVNFDNFDTIIVDNGSLDGSLDLISNNYPEVILVKNSENLGFSAACNQGIKYAFDNGAEAALLLNNDTVVDPDFITKMVEALEDDKVGIVGSKIYYYDEPKKIWFAGGRYIWWRVSGQHKLWMRDENKVLIGEEEADFITGCSMLIRKEVLEDIGYLFEPYFLTVEDLDFSILAKKAGWKIKVALDSMIWHKVSFSRDGEFSFSNGYYGTRNRLYFAFKRINNYIGGFFLLFIVVPIRIIQWTIQGKNKMVYGMILGVRDFLLGKMGKYK
ncbi:MAG: glycosyltransferase family 2 protein [Patescibacteria group bacterium]|jgi:GT2 family glycosyltransferase|nr:glycosyltransferase family 2 protein [Patescibacteria group bacterium]